MAILLTVLDGPPYPTDAGSLIVGFDATGILACHLATGWPVPARVLDLGAEFRNRTNGLDLPHGSVLFGALAWHGLNPIPGMDRPSIRALATRRGQRTAAEGAALLNEAEARTSATA